MKNINALFIEGETITRIKARISQQTTQQARSTVISSKLPHLVSEVVEKAETALNGQLLLPGTGGKAKFVGNPPNWYARMNDDNEFLWQLNRMEHWLPLLEAYSYTGKVEYAEKVIVEFLDWHQKTQFLTVDFSTQPLSYFNEVHPLRTLECGIRLYKTWPAIIKYLGDSPLLTEKIFEEYLLSVHKQTELLIAISPKLWPKADHNHYLMECLGIWTTALMFPEFKKSEEWKDFAYRELNRCSQAQLTQAGGQIEGCPSYHNGCMFWFSLVVILAKEAGITIAEDFQQRLHTNLNYSLHCMRPTGQTFPLGDSHSNNLSIMSGVYGYLAFDDPFWLRHMCSFLNREEIQKTAYQYIRYAEHPATFIATIEGLTELPEAKQLPLNLFNQELGQAFVRSNWTSLAQSYAFTCRSPIQNLHAHIDLLSFEYIALGKNIICDPGLYTYKNSAIRKEMKSTASHSTLMIDNKDFFEYISSWEYGVQKKGELTGLVKQAGTTFAHGYHLSYDPICVQRFLGLVDNRFLVVVDKVTTPDKGKIITRTFHLDYTDIEVRKDSVLGKDQMIDVKIVNYPDQQVNIRQGKLSDVNDCFRESRKVVYKGKYLEESYITVLYPYENKDEEPEISIYPISSENYHVKINQKKFEINIKSFEEYFKNTD
ncbi:heparinase II/III family protein [Candidatus Enterococcus clewellii]|uniref:heparinase II/III family protein n=1 Tax=Candidatus Enterococcus clewellii TaxID=1834193 RepID=UPI0030D1CAD2